MVEKGVIIGFIIVMLIVSLASAQECPDHGPPPGMPPDHFGGPPSPEQHLSRLKDALDLSKDQAAKIEAILDSIQSKCDVLMDQDEKAHEQSMDAMKKIMDEGDKQVEKLLTDKQKARFERMKKDRGRHHPPPDGPDDGPPMD